MANFFQRLFGKKEEVVPPTSTTEGTVTPPYAKPYEGKVAPVVKRMEEGYTQVKNGAEETAAAQLTGTAQEARRKQAEGSNSGGESGRRA